MQSAEPLITDVSTIGWREWLALPEFGIGAIKAKLDTGARTSSLCVVSVTPFSRGGRDHVTFLVRPRRRGLRTIACEAPVIDRRPVTDSGGHTEERWFIRTGIVLAGERFEADINLTDRRAMLFPLLLGRSAVSGRFRIDPALSYTSPRPATARIAR